MHGLQPFQYAGASADAQRVSLVQTTEFNDLITITTEHGDVGIFTACGELFRGLPRLAVEDDALMVVTVPQHVEVDWPHQTADWLIPFNSSDWDGGPLQTMLRLGTGSIALDYVAASPILERAVDALTVVYVLPDCVALVRYRWNALLLDALEGLFQATNLYASMVAESAAYRKRPKLSKDGIRQRQVYGSINDAGAVTFNL